MMEAKDTVISLGETTNESLRIMMEKILLEQAEISFKVGWQDGYETGKLFATINMPALIKEGKQEGIREVVEELSIVFITGGSAKAQVEEVYKILEKWQTKLSAKEVSDEL